MEILGIALQLVAGVIFGLDYLIPRTWILEVNKGLKWLILLPYSRRKYILSAIIWAGISTPGLLFVWNTLTQYAIRGMHEWYEWNLFIAAGVLVFLLTTVLVAIFYILPVKGVSHIVRKSNRLRNLVGQDSYLISLLGNGLLFAVFSLANVLFIFLVRILDKKETILGLMEPPISPFGYAFLTVWGISLIIIAISLVVLLVAGVMKLLQLLAKAKKGALWPIALFMYIAGGALLLVNACQSS